MSLTKLYQGDLVDVGPMLSDMDYRRQFRLSRNGVATLIDHIKPLHEGFLQSCSLEKQVHIFLWYAASTEVFRAISQKFSLDDSTTWRIIHRISVMISSVASDFIIWPENFEQVQNEFHTKT